MTKTLTILCLILCDHSWAQCGYPVTLRTGKDYCLGSSLFVTSPDALERIVWYKDGQPVDSALAEQSLESQAITFTLDGSGVGGDIASDASGNIYTVDFDHQRIVRWTPGLGTGVTTVGTFPRTSAGYIRLFVDHQGNVYAASREMQYVLKYAPGDTVGVTIAKGPPGNSYGFGAGLYVDCQDVLYVCDIAQQIVTKWPAGAASGTVVATGGGQGQPAFGGPIYVDSLGNVFSAGGNEVAVWSPGATSGIPIANWNPYSDFGLWMDGKDTAWVVGLPGTPSTPVTIDKIAPGASAAVIAGTCPAYQILQEPGITMDIRGNIFAMDGEDQTIFELKRTSSIDSAFTPTATGEYYAVVTNIQGYAAITNKIVINTPGAGTPSISISATATSTPVCTPITFTANATNAGLYPTYQWMVSGIRAGGDSTSYSYNLFSNGDQVYCILSAQAGCAGPVTDTSNIITLSIDPHGAASVTISTPKDSICQGDTAVFTATVINGSNQPVFEWLLNGDSTGDDSATFIRNNFSTGDVVTCLITSDDVCGLAKSNSIPLIVSIPPTVQSGQIFTILRGHTLLLDPITTGDISSYLWTPATGLSDPTIADPVASPDSNILYTLTVTAPGGCMASAGILVNVYTPISIPNAFTPNGNGHNDLFYVLGGPINSQVEEFAVFNRAGAEVFHVHHVAPGDPTFAWNGSFHGSPAPTGTYVYVVVMQFANASRQVYKGTVVLVR